MHIPHRLLCPTAAQQLSVELLNLLWLKTDERDASQRWFHVVADDLRVADERARAQR